MRQDQKQHTTLMPNPKIPSPYT